jgi:hypothetical protein
MRRAVFNFACSLRVNALIAKRNDPDDDIN